MHLKDLLSRIDLRSSELGLDDAAIARAAGKAEILRNWRRADAEGRDIHPRIDSLERIAAILQVPTRWLTEGTGYAETPAQTPGFAESEARPWTGQRSAGAPGQPTIAALIAPHVRSPMVLELTRAQPGLALLRGDVIVAEAQHRASRGDVVIVSFDEHGNGNPVTLVRRYLPPYLIGSAATDDFPVLTVDDTGRAVILGTVEASFRPPQRSD
jgi:hypothetical protein